MAFIQTQIQIPQLPINNKITGYDNTVYSSGVIISGSNNFIKSPTITVIGSNNTTSANNSNVSIVGTGNFINGSLSYIRGDNNIIYTFNSNISGDNNTVSGQYIVLNGSNNSLNSTSQIIKNVYINGDSNKVSGTSIIVSGDSNNVADGISDSYIQGNGNYIIGGLIIEDISGFTNSAPTMSVDPYLALSKDIYIQGNANIVATASTAIRIFGESNQMLESGANQVILGDGLQTTSANDGSFIIGYDVDIKGAVLPCNLIQTYTPTGATDSTYPVGSITKDNEQAYVNTNIGWQELPFRSYGTYYDTTTQTNPTASRVNKIKFNTNGDGANGVGITNSNDTILFNYSGMYNIQFSTQISKSGGGDSYVDIWFGKNNVDIPWSNTTMLMTKQVDKMVASWNWLYYFNSGDTANICWSSADTGISLFAIGTQSGPTRPAIPSAILTVWKV